MLHILPLSCLKTTPNLVGPILPLDALSKLSLVKPKGGHFQEVALCVEGRRSIFETCIAFGPISQPRRIYFSYPSQVRSSSDHDWMLIVSCTFSLILSQIWASVVWSTWKIMWFFSFQSFQTTKLWSNCHILFKMGFYKARDIHISKVFIMLSCWQSKLCIVWATWSIRVNWKDIDWRDVPLFPLDLCTEGKLMIQ
jgi:hypothetical protein